MNETTSGVGASAPAPEGRVRFEERNLGSCPGRTWLVWVDGEAAAWIFEESMTPARMGTTSR